MTEERPGVGGPPKYHGIIAQLEDDKLYSPSAIVREFGKGSRFAKHLLLRALIQRCARRDLRPDGFVGGPKGQQRAYLGKHWKETIYPMYLEQAASATSPADGTDVEGTAPRRQRSGMQMKYDHYIRHLRPFRLYTSRDVADHGMAEDLCSIAKPEEVEKERQRVEKAARAFSVRLPDRADRTRIISPYRTTQAWYGWRWQVALADELFSPERKRRLQRLARWHALANWKTGSLGVLLLGCFVLGFAVGPSKLLEGGQILREKGAKAAYQYFVQGGDAYQMLYGRAWSAFRNQQYAEASLLGEGLLQEAENDQGQADAHYLLGFAYGFLGDLDLAKDNLERAFELFYGIGKIQDAYQTLLGLARLSLERITKINVHDQALINEAENFLMQSEELGVKESALFFFLKSRIAFERGDFQTALTYSVEGSKLAGANKSRYAQGLSGQGFLLILLGDLDGGMEMTRHAETLALEQSDEIVYAYNLINEFLYLKCTNRTSPFVDGYLSEWSAKDDGVKYYFNFVKEFDCSSVDSAETLNRIPSEKSGDHDEKVDPTLPDPPTSMGGGGNRRTDERNP